MIMRTFLFLGLLLLGGTAYFVVGRTPPTVQAAPFMSNVTMLQEEGLLPVGPLAEDEEVEHDVFEVPPQDEVMLEAAIANMDMSGMDMGNMDMGTPAATDMGDMAVDTPAEPDMGNMDMGTPAATDMGDMAADTPAEPDMGNMDMGTPAATDMGDMAADTPAEPDMGNMDMGTPAATDMGDMAADTPAEPDMGNMDMGTPAATDMGDMAADTPAEPDMGNMDMGTPDATDMGDMAVDDGEISEEETERLMAGQMAGLIITDDGPFDREISLSMSEWTFSDLDIEAQPGERIRFTLRNDGQTLHEFMFMSMAGMQGVNYRARRADWSLLEHVALYEKSLMLPGEEITFVAEVLRPGGWMFMCMLPYHMQMGMMGQIATPGMAMDM